MHHSSAGPEKIRNKLYSILFEKIFQTYIISKILDESEVYTYSGEGVIDCLVGVVAVGFML